MALSRCPWSPLQGPTSKSHDDFVVGEPQEVAASQQPVQQSQHFHPSQKGGFSQDVKVLASYQQSVQLHPGQQLQSRAQPGKGGFSPDEQVFAVQRTALTGYGSQIPQLPPLVAVNSDDEVKDAWEDGVEQALKKKISQVDRRISRCRDTQGAKWIFAGLCTTCGKEALCPFSDQKWACGKDRITCNLCKKAFDPLCAKLLVRTNIWQSTSGSHFDGPLKMAILDPGWFPFKSHDGVTGLQKVRGIETLELVFSSDLAGMSSLGNANVAY